MRLDADRQFGDDLVHLVRHGLAEDEVVAALRHRDGEPDRRLAIESEHRLRRIRIAFAYRGDIGETEEFAVGIEIDALQIVDRVECTGDADRVFLETGLDDAGRRDRVLLLQTRDDLIATDTQPGQLVSVEFEIEFLVLGADQLRLRGILDRQYLCANSFDVVAQLAVREPVGRERVDNAEDVTELVIETRPQNALRQCRFYVGDLLADLVPDVRDRLLRRTVENVDIDRRDAGLGFALQVVERRRFLQFLLDPVGDLQHRVVDRGARPIGSHDHRLDRKRRVLLAAQLLVGKDARGDKEDHQKPHEGAMVDRPFGEIEALHCTVLASMRATFSPGSNFCTPAVTTTSPWASPSPTTTESPW